MYAVISPEKTQLPLGTVVRMPGTWQDYFALRDSRGDGSIPRIKYCKGEILLMSPSPRHGREANYRLQDNSYQRQTASNYFPTVNLPTVIAHVLQVASKQGTGVALREFRQQLKTS